MTKKKILLTGGNGFIGRNIIEQLSNEYEIFAPRRSELDLLNADAVEKFIKANDFDIIIHGANIGGNRMDPGPQNMVELNQRMFFNITRCKSHFSKMIHFGSGSEYGKQEEIKDVKEEEFDLRVPKDPYGFYKYICSKYIEKTDGIIGLRIFGCYGKYEDYSYKFISNAICRALSGMPITINNKNVVFSYLYVDDLIKVLRYFIENEGKHKFYNVTPSEKVDILTIAKLVKELNGENREVEVKNPGIGLEYTGSNKRLLEEIQGLKFTSIDEGVTKLFKWYKANEDQIDKKTVLFDK